MPVEHAEGDMKISRAEKFWQEIPWVPFCFLGFGLFRAWTGIVYIDGAISFPSQDSSSYFMFDAFTTVFLVGLACMSRKVSPLVSHRGVMPFAATCLSLCAFATFASLYVWPFTGAMSVVASLLVDAVGGLGTALLLMLWSEFFGCLNPLKIVLYYAAGIAVSVVVLWFMEGMSYPCVWVCAVLLPPILMLSLWRAYARLGSAEMPGFASGRFTFPWKPMLVVALYTFASGLQISLSSGALGNQSNPGPLLAACLIFLFAARKGDDFDFSLIWKIAMPLMIASFFVGVLPVPFRGDAAAVFAQAGYTMLLVLMMAILGNMSYRYGVCALWIFAIERAVRMVSQQMGYEMGHALSPAGSYSGSSADIALVALCVLLAAFATLIFASERQIDSNWGIVLKRPISQDLGFALEKSRLGVRCRELAKEYGLTPREEEVLLLICQGKKPSAIAVELCIGGSTVKTHTKHIYQKAGIHVKSDLLEMVGASGSEKQTRPGEDGSR